MADEVLIEEEAIEQPEAGTPVAATGAVEQITHTIEEIPTLAGLNVGDVITMSIVSISEDGVTFGMSPVTEAPPPVGVGAEEITNQFLA